MDNLNPYNKEKFKKQFQKTEIYKSLTNDFDILSWEKFFIYTPAGTPRQIIGDRSYKTMFSLVSFYYLQPLYKKNPKHIYDLGCGWNIYKKYISNIIGIGAEDPYGADFYADIHDYVDNDFIKGHQNYFESVFSICALHFHSLDNLTQIIKDFLSMIQPGGRGFLSLNLQRMIEKTQPDLMLSLFDTEHPSQSQYTDYVKNSLDSINCIFLIVDIDLTILDDGMDGNIRIVMEKHAIEDQI
jgi:hypothetical protein